MSARLVNHLVRSADDQVRGPDVDRTAVQAACQPDRDRLGLHPLPEEPARVLGHQAPVGPARRQIGGRRARVADALACAARIPPAGRGELGDLRDCPGQPVDPVVAAGGLIRGDQATVLERQAWCHRVNQRPLKECPDPGLDEAVVYRPHQVRSARVGIQRAEFGGPEREPAAPRRGRRLAAVPGCP